MLHAIPSFERARVLIVGDVILDRYWYGATGRISPEAPVPVVRVDRTEARPGGAANVALNITSLGGSAMLVGVTGDDEAADQLEGRLSEQGVRCRLERMPDTDTVTKLRVLSRNQQLIRLDFDSGFEALEPDRLLAHYRAFLGDADVVILSDYAKGALPDTAALIAAARDMNLPILVDPKGSDFSRYRGASFVTPNMAEFEAVAGPCADDDDLVRKAHALCGQHDFGGVLVTRSGEGMTLVRRNGESVHLPARAREVYDVTGAGDTVIGVFGACVAAGLAPDEAAAIANLAASLVVAKQGAASVSAEELRLAGASPGHDAGLLDDRYMLMTRIERARADGEIIVMTNGCFDILHPGHVRYLARAAELGDRLVVAVNDDASVARLKGDGRPVHGLRQRMEVLAALACVDWVVPFSEDTPEGLICEVKPDVLVKGGDYRADEIAGGRCVEEAGGRVVILDFEDGFSTSATIDRIRHPAGGNPAGHDPGWPA